MASSMPSAVAAAPAAGRDLVHGFTRFVAALLGIVVLYASVVLSLFPDQAERLFAWKIQPPITAAFMGAAYANGVVFFATVLFGRRWHRVAAPHVGVFVFSSLLLATTFAHWERFSHGHPVFWAWVFIYAVAPVLVPIAFFRNRREDTGAFEERDARVPAALRVGWAIAGAAFLVASLFLMVAPERIIPAWPWKLTPLTARVVLSFYAILGAAPLSVAREPRWSAWRVGAWGVALWHALLLLQAFRLRADLAAPLASTPWFWGECALLAATLATIAAMEARVRPMAGRAA